MMPKLNAVLAATAAITLSAAPLSAQWGIFGGRSSNGVPSGHMPSRGMCRVWIDGVYDGNGTVAPRRDGVYRDSRGRVIRRDDGVWRDNRGRVYDRRGRND